MDPRPEIFSRPRHAAAENPVADLCHTPLEEILPVFGQTLILKEGRVLYSGATHAVLKPDILRELYGVSLHIMKRKGRHWPVLR
jgi:ABC-type cobalamin transport system ATPase subunit